MPNTSDYRTCGIEDQHLPRAAAFARKAAGFTFPRRYVVPGLSLASEPKANVSRCFFLLDVIPNPPNLAV
jgi:hypothetical protein